MNEETIRNHQDVNKMWKNVSTNLRETSFLTNKRFENINKCNSVSSSLFGYFIIIEPSVNHYFAYQHFVKYQ